MTRENPATLLRGGRVAAGAAGSPEPGPASLLLEQGLISRIGDPAEVEGGLPPGCRVVELDGALVLPGLVDSHCHFGGWAWEQSQLNLGTAASLEQALALVAEAASAGSGWLIGFNWDESNWAERRPPHRLELDRAGQGRPVMLRRRDRHSLVASTAALAAAGIGLREWQPTPGGGVSRLEDGTLDGWMRESAGDQVLAAIPWPEAEERARAIVEGQREAWAMGLVGVHEMASGIAPLDRSLLPSWQMAEQDPGYRFRCTIYPPAADLDALLRMGIRSGHGSPGLRIQGVKLFLDGSLGSRTAQLLEPYEGTDQRGLEAVSDPELEEILSRCRRAGLSPAIHAIGDGAVRRAIRSLGRQRPQSADSPADWLPRIEHLQLLAPDDLPPLVASGATASMQPIHCVEDIELAELLWGTRVEHAYPWRRLEQAGVPLAFGSDAPVSPIDPWRGLEAAIRRLDPRTGRAWHRGQSLDPLSALRAYTRGAARAAGLGGLTGELRPGAWADLAVVDRLARDPADWETPQVLSTWVAGERVF